MLNSQSLMQTTTQRFFNIEKISIYKLIFNWQHESVRGEKKLRKLALEKKVNLWQKTEKHSRNSSCISESF